LISPLGNSAKICDMFTNRSLDLVVSEGILDEYEDVLYRRPRLKLSIAKVDNLLGAIWQNAEIIYPVVSLDTMPDETDRVFYDTAKTAGVYLITGNTKHFPQEPFILTPAEFAAKEWGDYGR
jgi:putative PIN family toxin of toxin-antitoxin system